MTILYDNNIKRRTKTLDVSRSSLGHRQWTCWHVGSSWRNPLVTEENVEVWPNYLKEKLPGLINNEAIESDVFRQVEEKAKSWYKEELRWKKRKTIAKYRQELLKVPKHLGCPSIIMIGMASISIQHLSGYKTVQMPPLLSSHHRKDVIEEHW